MTLAFVVVYLKVILQYHFRVKNNVNFSHFRVKILTQFESKFWHYFWLENPNSFKILTCTLFYYMGSHFRVIIFDTIFDM